MRSNWGTLSKWSTFLAACQGNIHYGWFLKLIMLLFLLFYKKSFLLSQLCSILLPTSWLHQSLEFCHETMLLYQQFKYAFACFVLQDLCEYIKRRDTLLLQAFRSSKTAGTSEQLQANFKQYLSGMLCNL